MGSYQFSGFNAGIFQPTDAFTAEMCYNQIIMTRQETLVHLNRLFWDKKLDPEKLFHVLLGREKEDSYVQKEKIFSRMLASLPWHLIVDMLGIDEVKNLLTKKVIDGLWPKSLREQYERIRKILHGEPVSPAKWGTPEARKYTFPVLSDRWYASRT